MPLISVVVVNYRTPELTSRCVRSVQSFIPDAEVVVVDSASGDGSSEKIAAECENIKIVALLSNLGFGAAVNTGFAESSGEFLIVLNSDIILLSFSRDTLISYFEQRQDVAVLGMKLLRPSGEVQRSYGKWPTPISVGVSEMPGLRNLKWLPIGRYRGFNPKCSEPCAVDWVTGAAMIIPRKSLDNLKGFNEQYFMYYEDVDLCIRAKKAGLLTVYHPSFVAEHRHGASSKPALNQTINLLKVEEKKSALLFFGLHFSKKVKLIKTILRLVYGYRIAMQKIKWFFIFKSGKKTKAQNRLSTYQAVRQLFIGQ